MSKEKKAKPDDFERLDDWMKQFLDDPYAIYDDIFPIDLYETTNEYIVEADISSFHVTQIEINYHNQELCLTVKTEKEDFTKNLFLPFDLTDKSIETECANHILSIKIAKQQNGDHSSFSIILPFQ
ncbi:Hsp20/alpha crystallin family protein [Bacillus gobiensis]|uniref:SHSP domain-containing protein n=1 Tax=Bacillus gobiensis TaxID=1441095 RepID=A0A0M3R9B7_9BACI|nr:Hsp20 family protein [Bacillus gobiensis]ALC81162.1 hypothetical protein AM592_05790 [Bacillus gobiensis]